jgi:LPS-assembly protein
MLPSPARSLSLSQQSDLPYHIKADTLNYDDATKTYQARGGATISRGDRSLHADAVDFNEETGEAKAWGDVRLFSGKDLVKGSRIEVNLDAGIGTVYDATLFIAESHVYIQGEEIHKTGKDSYYIKGAAGFTTCDGDRPDWKLTGRDLRITIEGYGTVKHAAFRVKSIPILYSPYLVFPVKIKRQTGLLIPQPAYSNSSGFQYNQPFFWAIGDSSDATYYLHYMDHRGFKHGFEYRYALSPGSKGAAMYDYLWDWQIDDGSTRADSEGYHYEGFRGDDVDRLNRARWWFRSKSDQDLPAGFKAKLDLDIVSDQDYLREFVAGYSSYESSDRYFREEFGRGLDDKTDTTRQNQLNFNRTWTAYSLNLDFRWWDDVIIRTQDLDDTTLQNLPSVTFTGSRQQISDSPLYFDLKSSYNHFWRKVGTQGHSVDLFPRIYYPVSLFKYFDFEPSVGVRETVWRAENGQDQSGSRALYDLKGDLSTEISRIFNVGGKRVDKIRHEIRPQVVYEFVPEVEQEDLPDFVSEIGRKNLVTYSVTNNFTARMAKRTKPDLRTGPESEKAKYSYHDFCRLKFSQDYDFIEARQDQTPGGPRPFSDIRGELEFTALQYLNLKANAAWSPYDLAYTSYDALVGVRDKRGDWGSVDYRYERDIRETVLAKVFVRLFDPVSVYWEHERNLFDGKDVGSRVAFRYESQCWSFGVIYRDDRATDVREYIFQIGLFGLGGTELLRHTPRGVGGAWWERMG